MGSQAHDQAIDWSPDNVWSKRLRLLTLISHPNIFCGWETIGGNMWASRGRERWGVVNNGLGSNASI